MFSFFSLTVITSTYRWLICWLLKETHDKYESELAKGLSKFEARARSQVYKWRELTKSYAEYLAIIFFLESMDKKEDGLKPVLHKLFCLYGLWSLDQHLVELYQGGYSQVRCCVNYILKYI